jgi:coenzyme F420 hydrogenase subunit beta
MRIDDRFGHFIPKVNENCVDCNLCIKVCPGYEMDFDDVCKISNELNNNINVGCYSKCYVGYSSDTNIRYNSASGGLITQILCYLLDEKRIDGALVTTMDPNNPLEPLAFLAFTKDEIVKASKSKYCPVSLADGFKQIMQREGKFAVVGLPCHIHGLRKAEALLPKLKGKIMLRLGLLCSHMVSFHGVNFILNKIGVSPSNVAEINYRGEGWPGFMSIKTRKGKSVKLPLIGSWFSYWPVFSSYLFTPKRCLMCPDQMAELADAAFGDAWLPEFRNDKVGRSIIISKSTIVDEILAQMSLEKKIALKNIPVEKIERSQESNIIFKKVDIGTRFAYLSSKNQKIPVYHPTFKFKMSFISLIRTMFVLTSVNLSENRLFQKIGVKLPLPFFRLYFGFFKFLYKI